MNRRLLWRCALLLVSLATLAGARAESVPARGAVDARIREVTYNAEEVYRLTGYVGYQLEFEFSEGERFVGLAAGDVKALSFESEGNHLFLKPTAPGVLTNLTILTTRHHYRVDYAVATGRPDLSRADVIYAVRRRCLPDRSGPANAGRCGQLGLLVLRTANTASSRGVRRWLPDAPALLGCQRIAGAVHPQRGWQ
ncbi:MAG: TrbG/VirB9 family P-type conjugative transfer protein [Steroidobacteraceae bacterium]